MASCPGAALRCLANCLPGQLPACSPAARLPACLPDWSFCQAAAAPGHLPNRPLPLPLLPPTLHPTLLLLLCCCSWWVLDLGPEHQLICNHYTLRHDGSHDFLRSWVLQVRLGVVRCGMGGLCGGRAVGLVAWRVSETCSCYSRVGRATHSHMDAILPCA